MLISGLKLSKGYRSSLWLSYCCFFFFTVYILPLNCKKQMKKYTLVQELWVRVPVRVTLCSASVLYTQGYKWAGPLSQWRQ